MRYGYKENGTLLNVLSINPDKKRVGLLFYHGIGDCCMFMPSVKKLSCLYPNIEFSVLTLSGQEDLFILNGIKSEPYTNDESFDGIIYDITFPISTLGNITKNDYCCKLELGIDSVEEDYIIKETNNSKLVGIHFNNTCLPEGANPDSKIAKIVWDSIKKCGFIPIESHMIHPFANPANVKFDFVDLTTRDMCCEINNLIGVIKSCYMFFGVNSGPYFCAMRELGINNVIMLEKDYKINTVVKNNDAITIDIKNPTEDYIEYMVRELLNKNVCN